jgi:hypothetical protein
MAITLFQPEIWAAEILVALRNSLVYGGLVNRDYEGLISQAGDTVKITSFNDPAVRNYTKNSNITWDLLTDTQQSLVVDQADYFAFTVDDVDKRQALGGFVEKAAQGAAYNLVKEADTYVADLMIASADGSANDIGAVAIDGSSVKAYDDLLLPLRTAMVRSNVPASGRWVVVPPEVYGQLLLDDRFIRADAVGNAQGLREGFVGRAAGFDVFESNTVPEPTAGTYHVIAGHPWAVTYADQINETEALRLENQFGDGIRGLHLYGAKVIRPTLLKLASVTVS